MNLLTKWNPLRELETMQNRMSNLFGRPLMPFSGDETFAANEWTPLVDVAEDDKEFTIKVDLPEVKKDDVKVLVEDGSLKILGERKLEKEEKGLRYHRIERAYGAFERSFILPEGARGDQVSAEFKDGLLKVHLPKSEEAKSQSLQIPVS